MSSKNAVDLFGDDIPDPVPPAQTEPVNDPVNHPAHYTSHPSGTECIDIIEHLPYNVGAAIKYLWRRELKGATLQDLEKARWYIDREIQRVKKFNR